MRRRDRLGALAGVVVGVSFLAAMNVAAYLLTALIYAWIGWRPSLLPLQVINLLVGLALVFVIVYILSRFFRSRQLAIQMGMFQPIIDAMERIAKGDFSVRLENDERDDGPVGTLVKSVNTMALELNQMEEMRQEFISTVSHEIQSPLTSIRGFARALQNDRLAPEERQHYLSIIETESMRLSKLSDNLLALAALDAESSKFAPQPYRLDKQIRDVVLACEPQWVDKALELEVALEELVITADADLLGQVWANLLHNSIKFTPVGGRICLDLRPQEGMIAFRISDTGIGIAPDDQAHVFERFFKADRSRERARGGSGLGLAIAQKIVELHHGRISVASTLGAGTTFHVVLPAQVPAEPVLHYAQELDDAKKEQHVSQS